MNTTTRILTATLLAAGQIALADPNNSSIIKTLPQDAGFTTTVQPFVSSYCLGCHNSKMKTANLDLQQFTSVDSVRANLKVWKKVAWRLEAGEMPPAKTPHPKLASQKAVLKWIKAELVAADTKK